MTNAAPGPGQWALDTGHFPRPATRFTAELFPEPSRKGFADGTAPFGLLLDFLEWAFVDGWGYLSPRPVPALREAGPLTRPAWDDLVRSSPELEARLAVSARVFEDRAWRHDLALWDGELKPSLVAGHIRVQATDPASLSDTALLDHLDQCRENLRTAIWAHHRFNVTPVLPVGELLARCREWTDASAVDVLGLLRGAGPLAVGASDELARAADAIRADLPSHTAVSSSGDAAEGLASLLVRPGSTSTSPPCWRCPACSSSHSAWPWPETPVPRRTTTPWIEPPSCAVPCPSPTGRNSTTPSPKRASCTGCAMNERCTATCGPMASCAEPSWLLAPAWPSGD